MSATVRPSVLARRLAPTADATSTGSPVLAEARETTERVATTFALACRLLPAAIRDDVYLLYLVFRTLDDLVDDGHPDARARVTTVDAWARGRSFVATRETDLLAGLARRYPVPRDALADFCSGMFHDLERRPVLTEADLDVYCYRVAGTVGIVMSALLGTEDPERARPAAAALGMAMQRTNILRDIDEDAAAGRTYLAQETLARFGSPAPGHRAALLRDQIARADVLYDSGLAGLAQLQSGRRAIAAAAGMYREILREIERRGLGAEPGRAIVSRPRKLLVAVRTARRV